MKAAPESVFDSDPELRALRARGRKAFLAKHRVGAKWSAWEDRVRVLDAKRVLGLPSPEYRRLREFRGRAEKYKQAYEASKREIETIQRTLWRRLIGLRTSYESLSEITNDELSLLEQLGFKRELAP